MGQNSWIVSYFSATGTTEKIARAIAEGFEAPVISMDLSKKEAFEAPDDFAAVLAAVPVYAGRVPAPALERLSQLNGKGKKAVAVVVYGNREFDDALLELKTSLEALGFEVVAAAAFVAEHSIIRSIAAGRPDASDLEIARSFGAEVRKKLDFSEAGNELQVPGTVPYVEPKPSMFHPEADERCKNCGYCAKECPVSAIPFEQPNTTLPELCINCMRCVEICPEHARSLPKIFLTNAKKMLEEKAAGYKKPELFL